MTQNERVLAFLREHPGATAIEVTMGCSPCRFCGRTFGANNIGSHERSCDPVAREARRLRRVMASRATRARPGWQRPSDKRDACPDCGAPKLIRSARCRSCDGGGVKPREFDERFWEKVDKRGPDECWPWLGSARRGGYGAFSIGHARAKGAHRVALELTIGPLPKGQGALHTCDNPPCCNPAHLYAGTQADNAADMVRRGRDRWHRGAA